MKKFRVEIEDITIWVYEVEAETEEDAIDMAQDDQVMPSDMMLSSNTKRPVEIK